LTVPHSPLHHAVSDPRHIEPDRRISRIRLTAKASSIEVMLPLPGVVRIGRRVLLRRAALLHFLDHNSTPSPQEARR